MVYFILLVCVALLALLAYVAHKVRRIHLASSAVLEEASTARREAAALFDQLHALSSLERLLALPQSLPPMRGWAASPDLLLHLTQLLRERQPLCVVECSSGVSTVVAARCMELNGRGHVYSLEHDPVYAAKTISLLQRYGLTDWATVVLAPLQPVEGASAPDATEWYSHQALPADIPPIEVLVVDGPPAGGNSTARYPALGKLAPRMAADVTVLLDDADRLGERAVVDRWLAEHPGLRLERLAAEKGLAKLSGRP
jgi:hypothetical protein